MIPRVGHVKEITSSANPVIKALKALSLKKNRNRERLFLAEGLKLAIQGLELGWTIHTLVIAKSDSTTKLISGLAAKTIANGGLVIEAPQKVISTITRRDNPQTVLAVFEQKWLSLDNLRPSDTGVYLALDRIRDPGNLGTIIRTLDAVGGKGIVLVGDTTDPYSLETVRATMGSIFAVPLYRADQSEFLRWRDQSQFFMVGTHLKGARDYRQISYQKPTLLLMGNEQQGLTDALAQACDALVRIPQSGQADSLNLAVATGIMLYEVRRDQLVLERREVK